MQKTEKRLQVRNDVQQLPEEVAAWMPAPVAEASEALEQALDRREELEVGFEIAESDYRTAQRAAHAEEDAAVAHGKPVPVASSAAADTFDAARRSRNSADRVAAAAIDAYLQALDQHSGEIGEILGARMAAVQDRARQHLAEVDQALVEQIQLDRLSNVLRDARRTGSSPVARRAWETPPPDRHVGLQAVSELFAICGGRAERSRALLKDATTAVMTDLLRGGPVSAAAADADPAPLTTTLTDGTTGWYMRRGDDCWSAAIATVLQVPLDELPDLRLDERLRNGERPVEIAISTWETIEDWLAERGLRMLVHSKVPVRRRRWIGCVPVEGNFQSHCFVMAGPERIFDPAEGLLIAGSSYKAKHVGFGFSFVHTQHHRSEDEKHG